MYIEIEMHFSYFYCYFIISWFCISGLLVNRSHKKIIDINIRKISFGYLQLSENQWIQWINTESQ